MEKSSKNNPRKKVYGIEKKMFVLTSVTIG